MQLRYVFSETGTGLRRNVSMTIALVVTIFVSLTLVGMGLLLNQQAQKAEDYWGSKLQITVYLCNQNSRTPHCTSGAVNDAQKAAIKEVIDTHPEVASSYLQTKEEAYATWKRVFISKDKTEQQIYATVTPEDMQESYWVTLKDPNQFRGVESALSGMDGVASVHDLRAVLKPIYFWMSLMKWGALFIAGFLLVAAILQVGNTIRLAAFARRKEIGIMRLVGASNLYISLPFLMETLVAALIGVLLASLAIGAVMYWAVYGRLRNNSQIVEWVDWHDALVAVGGIAILGVLITLIPTLVMTRKYLKV
ncbi:permease-like cell division protein FtsX [Marmoricola sp. RAF53]|uniref:permease-like cell division protein FtsX n=1 Tax=Marmoricola sp. RAF53 TaxID=3233059 RepID=UPI003F9C2741